MVAIPSLGRIQNQAIQCIHRMIVSTTAAEAIDLRWENAYPTGYCRNRLVRRFLSDPQWTHLLFVDSDMAPAADGLDRLLEVGAPIVAGPAPILMAGGTRDHPMARLTTNVMDMVGPDRDGRAAELNDESELNGAALRWTYRDWEDWPSEPFHCDATGVAFVLIQREVFERMEPPWLQFVEQPDGRPTGVDAYFFRKARQHGYRLTMQPTASCDHIKAVDLTHLEELLAGVSARRRWPVPPGTTIPNTVVLACTSDAWSSLPTTEALLTWQGAFPGCLTVRSVIALSPREALARFMHDPLWTQPDWTHLLMLGPDVVPERETLASLAAVDAPLVSAVTRRQSPDGLVYGFAVTNPETGRAGPPRVLPSAAFTRPAEVYSVDLSCALVTRDALDGLSTFVADSATEADPDASFSDLLCESVRARGRKPIVIPATVERWAEVGLLGLLRLKQQLADGRAGETAGQAPEPALALAR